MESTLQDLLSRTGDNPFVHAAILIVASVLLAVITDQVISRGLKVWAKKSSTDLDDRLLEHLHRPIFISVLVAGLYLALIQIDLGPQTMRFFKQILKTLIFWLDFKFYLKKRVV